MYTLWYYRRGFFLNKLSLFVRQFWNNVSREAVLFSWSITDRNVCVSGVPKFSNSAVVMMTNRSSLPWTKEYCMYLEKDGRFHTESLQNLDFSPPPGGSRDGTYPQKEEKKHGGEPRWWSVTSAKLQWETREKGMWTEQKCLVSLPFIDLHHRRLGLRWAQLLSPSSSFLLVSWLWTGVLSTVATRPSQETHSCKLLALIFWPLCLQRFSEGCIKSRYCFCPFLKSQC